jgi:hypothetical protein
MHPLHCGSRRAANGGLAFIYPEFKVDFDSLYFPLLMSAAAASGLHQFYTWILYPDQFVTTKTSGCVCALSAVTVYPAADDYLRTALDSFKRGTRAN